MKRQLLYIFIFSLWQQGVQAQLLTVETCHEKARTNYPLVKQYSLIEQTASYNISNANKAYLPQLSLSARATYQSDVTELPEALSQRLGISLPGLSKDQYQAVVEANQLIWDGGVISAQKKITDAGSKVEKKKLDVDLYVLNDRVNQLYFGILLLTEQLKQINILQQELQTNYNRIKAFKQNGVATETDLDAMQVELLNANQRETEIKSTKKAYCIVLSEFTGLEINENSELSKPLISADILNNTNNHRPELDLFEAQNNIYENQKRLLNAGNMPKLGAFLQGGYGKPALNMFTNSFSPFYMGGLRLSWNFSGLYTQKNNIEKIEVSKKSIQIQRETFLFNTNINTNQQKVEIEKLQANVKNDEEIIRLRGKIKKSASAKVENGILTVTDLIREINAENQAIQMKSLHEIQLLMSIYQLKNNLNN